VTVPLIDPVKVWARAEIVIAANTAIAKTAPSSARRTEHSARYRSGNLFKYISTSLKYWFEFQALAASGGSLQLAAILKMPTLIFLLPGFTSLKYLAD
jgi:hypothetical protein